MMCECDSENKRILKTGSYNIFGFRNRFKHSYIEIFFWRFIFWCLFIYLFVILITLYFVFSIKGKGSGRLHEIEIAEATNGDVHQIVDVHRVIGVDADPAHIIHVNLAHIRGNTLVNEIMYKYFFSIRITCKENILVDPDQIHHHDAIPAHHQGNIQEVLRSVDLAVDLHHIQRVGKKMIFWTNILTYIE